MPISPLIELTRPKSYFQLLRLNRSINVFDLIEFSIYLTLWRFAIIHTGSYQNVLKVVIILDNLVFLEFRST